MIVYLEEKKWIWVARKRDRIDKYLGRLKKEASMEDSQGKIHGGVDLRAGPLKEGWGLTGDVGCDTFDHLKSIFKVKFTSMKSQSCYYQGLCSWNMVKISMHYYNGS